MDAGNRLTTDLEVVDQRVTGGQASSDGFQTERIEQTRGKLTKKSNYIRIVHV
jgi:hypothetical protein